MHRSTAQHQFMQPLPDRTDILFDILFRHIPKESSNKTVIAGHMLRIRYRRFKWNDEELVLFEILVQERVFPFRIKGRQPPPFFLCNLAERHALLRKPIRIQYDRLQFGHIGLAELFNRIDATSFRTNHFHNEPALAGFRIRFRNAQSKNDVINISPDVRAHLLPQEFRKRLVRRNRQTVFLNAAYQSTFGNRRHER